MNKEQFWEIIDNINATVDHSDQEAILKATEDKLLQLTAKDLIDWYNIQHEYHAIAYRADLWAACAATGTHSTDDGFIDFRHWLISMGKEVYMNALQNPETLADTDMVAGEGNFESYGYVALRPYTIRALLEDKGFDFMKELVEWPYTHPEFVAFYPRDTHEVSTPSFADIVVRSYENHLSMQYDVMFDSTNAPLPKEAIEDIRAEIDSPKDIKMSDWNYENLDQLYPRLYAKFIDGSDTKVGVVHEP